jgi:hypothetical protein
MATQKIINRVHELDTLINQAQLDEVWGIEPDSTWETEYEFVSIELKKTRVTIKYWEYNGRPTKLVTDYALLSNSDDVNYLLSWIRRSINKGYTAAKYEAIREAKENAL